MEGKGNTKRNNAYYEPSNVLHETFLPVSQSLTCSCCWRARSICCRCFSICEAASFFCSSWAARSCSRKLISWVIMVESCRSFSARLSGVPKHEGKMHCKYQVGYSY